MHVFVLTALLFGSLACYLTWFELYGKTDIMQSSYNKRLQIESSKIIRGSILDRSGVVLATVSVENGIKKRVYPFKNLYTHIIGYDSPTYGKTLLESKYNDVLLGKSALAFISEVENIMTDEAKRGYTLNLTLDNLLQMKSRSFLGKNHGAIIAINPKTGEILTMVSTPDFDTNEDALENDWLDLTENENSPFLPRATMGLYPPGSTFKVITTLAAIENGLKDTRFEDKGSVVIDGKTFSNYGGKAHGELDLTKALTYSSNVYFAQLSELIGAKVLTSMAGKFGISRNFDFDISLTQSRIGTADMGKTELAATAIGQGKLMVTPLQMAMVASGIANHGNLMKPFVVGSISDSNGKVLKTMLPESLYTFTDTTSAQLLTDMMVHVVKTGTGKKAQIPGISVAGKTGTAENEKSRLGQGYDHAWFIGFAPAEDPQIAVAVILEYQGKGGGQAAAPIAKKVMDEWLKELKAK